MGRKFFWLIAAAALIGFGYYSFTGEFDQRPPDAAEMAAMQSLQSIVTAQKQYKARFGSYAQKLYQLGPWRGEDPREGAQLLPWDVARGSKAQYVFQMRVYGDEFSVTAEPEPGVNVGYPRLHLFTDQSGVIRGDPENQATATSPVVR